MSENKNNSLSNMTIKVEILNEDQIEDLKSSLNELANKPEANLTLKDIDLIKDYVIRIAIADPNDFILDQAKKVVEAFSYLNNINLGQYH